MAKTVKVRIAVALGRDAEGEWNESVGLNAAVAEERLRFNRHAEHAVTHWVTATLPVPEPVEVEGVVEEIERPTVVSDWAEAITDRLEATAASIRGGKPDA